MAIPVIHEDHAIAVLTREWSNLAGRQRGELERTYLSLFERFATMISCGTFPFEARRGSTSIAPRVGDGVIVLDEDARVRFASPNAVSALHRVGITVNVTGLRLAELGFNDGPVRSAVRAPRAGDRGVRADGGRHVADRTAIPILAGDQVSRRRAAAARRDGAAASRRLLLSKDATIREIHHRVKNNLQTISSLLRLQARRLTAPEAKAAVNESVRRIRTIALVHETLSREPGDDVAFIEIVRPLLRLAEEGLQSPDRPVRFSVKGDGGQAAGDRRHAVVGRAHRAAAERRRSRVPGGQRRWSGRGELENDGGELRLRVVDNGLGLPAGFSIDNATGLGLSIVRTLVTTELAGTISMRAATPDDFSAAGLSAPVRVPAP